MNFLSVTLSLFLFSYSRPILSSHQTKDTSPEPATDTESAVKVKLAKTKKPGKKDSKPEPVEEEANLTVKPETKPKVEPEAEPVAEAEPVSEKEPKTKSKPKAKPVPEVKQSGIRHGMTWPLARHATKRAKESVGLHDLEWLQNRNCSYITTHQNYLRVYSNQFLTHASD